MASASEIDDELYRQEQASRAVDALSAEDDLSGGAGGAASRSNTIRGNQQGSILFPTSPSAASTSNATPKAGRTAGPFPTKVHARSNSYTSLPGGTGRPTGTDNRFSLMSGLSSFEGGELMDAIRAYGAAGEDTRSIKAGLGGSRPPSRAAVTAAGAARVGHHTKRPSMAYSVAGSEAGTIAGGAPSTGYLFPQSHEYDDGGAGMSSASAYGGDGPLGATKAKRIGRMSYLRARTGSGRLGVPFTQAEEEDTPAVPPLPEGLFGEYIYGGQPLRYVGVSEFKEAEAWYLLRALVSEELKQEEAKLWSVDGLGEMDRSAREIPILRYVIKHFLLTLPLIRDTTPSTPTLGGRNPDDDLPAFWTDGLLPLIRAVHDADLSEPIDRGGRGPGALLWGQVARKAVERFVSGGLKIAREVYDETAQLDARGDEDFNGDARPSSAYIVPANDNAVSSAESSPVEQHLSDLSSAAPPVRQKRVSKVNPLLDLKYESYSQAKYEAQHLYGSNNTSPTLSRSGTSEALSNGNATPLQSSPTRTRAVGLFGSAGAGAGLENGKASMSEAGTVKGAPIGMNEDAAPSRPSFSTERSMDETASFVSATEGNITETESEEGDHSIRNIVLDSNLFPVAATSGANGHAASNGVNNSKTADSSEQTTPKLDQAELPTPRVPQVEEDTDPSTPRFGYGPRKVGATGDFNQVLPQKVPSSRPFSVVAASQKKDNKHSPTLSTSTFASTTASGANGNTTKKKRSFLGSLFSRKKKEAGAATPSTISSPMFPAVAEPASSRTLPKPQAAPIAAAGAPASPQREPGVASPPQSPQQQQQEEQQVITFPSRTRNNTLPNGKAPTISGPVSVDLVPRAGFPWPWGNPVAFWRGANVQRLKWGGFEADIVGVRKTLLSRSFIIRVRRPGRLDEYVLRDEKQFKKYSAILEKEYPNAHVRRIPAPDLKGDDIVPPMPESRPGSPSSTGTRSVRRNTVGSIGAFSTRPESTMTSTQPPKKLPRSTSRLSMGLKDAATDGGQRKTTQSPFAKSLRDSAMSDAGSVKGVRTSTMSIVSRPYSLAASRRQSLVNLPSHLSGSYSFDPKNLPPHDAYRRQLRSWLRDTLAVRSVGHNKETARFLLLGSFVPKEVDLKDVRQREAIDEARRSARVGVAQGAAERSKTLHAFWTSVQRECVHGDGFAAISEALRTAPSIEKLPVRFTKSIEWLRMSAAQTLYDMFVGGDGFTSGAFFLKMKAVHQSIPWFLVKQALKLPKAALVIKALQDILISKPMRGKSLLQKILSATLDDDATALQKQIQVLRSRIGSTTMCQKLEAFVYAERDVKETIRRYAIDNNLDIAVCIVRGGDEPRLDRYDLDRVIKSSKAFRAFMSKRPSPLAKAQTDNPDVRLILDLQRYLNLISADRDANAIRGLLTEDDTAAALEALAAPFVEFIKRTYKVSNASQAVTDLQKFLDQLIIIVEALRTRIQDPQKSIRILARLLTRHEPALYKFLHLTHKNDTIVEEFLQWSWTAAVFLRRGLAETVDLDNLLPEDPDERAFFKDEVAAVVSYNKKKRVLQYQNLCRRFAGDVDGDDPVVIDGDGKGKSRLEPIQDSVPPVPRLLEIPEYVSAFRAQLARVFSPNV